MTVRRVLLAGVSLLVDDSENIRHFWDLVDLGKWELATLAAIKCLAQYRNYGYQTRYSTLPTRWPKRVPTKTIKAAKSDRFRILTALRARPA